MAVKVRAKARDRVNVRMAASRLAMAVDSKAATDVMVAATLGVVTIAAVPGEAAPRGAAGGKVDRFV